MRQAYLVSQTQALNALEAMELTVISEHMCGTTYPLTPWTPRLITVCEMLYRRFLELNIRYPEETIVPTRDIDEFWHAHILHSQKYVRDCEALFGRYLHHQPSRSDEVASLSPLFERSKALYHQCFGENLQVLVRQ